MALPIFALHKSQVGNPGYTFVVFLRIFFASLKSAEGERMLFRGLPEILALDNATDPAEDQGASGIDGCSH